MIRTVLLLVPRSPDDASGRREHEVRLMDYLLQQVREEMFSLAAHERQPCEFIMLDLDGRLVELPCLPPGQGWGD
jgi:hypothetical protein